MTRENTIQGDRAAGRVGQVSLQLGREVAPGGAWRGLPAPCQAPGLGWCSHSLGSALWRPRQPPVSCKMQGLEGEQPRRAKIWSWRWREARGCPSAGGNDAVTAATSASLPASLISSVPRTINPSRLPVVPYRVAEARTEPLKLTITQSECLFGVIEALGKVREGRRKALVAFWQDTASPAALGQPAACPEVVLEQDECLNNGGQTALPAASWKSPGHRRLLSPIQPQSPAMGTPWGPLATGVPIPCSLQGWLVPVGGEVILGEILLFQVFSPSTCAPTPYLLPLPSSTMSSISHPGPPPPGQPPCPTPCPLGHPDITQGMEPGRKHPHAHISLDRRVPGSGHHPASC